MEYWTVLNRASYTDIGAAPDIMRIDWPPVEVQVNHSSSAEELGLLQLPVVLLVMSASPTCGEKQLAW